MLYKQNISVKVKVKVQNKIVISGEAVAGIGGADR